MSGLWQQAKDALAEKRGLLAAGSDLPWRTDRFFWKVGSTRGDVDVFWASVENEFGTVARERDNTNEAMPDMRLIVSAVNDYELMLDALEAVLDRHAPDAGAGPIWCEADAYDWPCTDAQAVLTALGVVS